MRWHEKVKQRDGMKCVVCGRTDDIQAHHIKPIFLYPEYKWDVDNGITLCKGCHQKQHSNNFSGGRPLEVDNKDPDPDGRMEPYLKQRREKEENRLMVYVVWGTSKENGGLVFEAAEKAGQDPRNYIGEAVSMRLKAEGFDHDESMFVKKYLEKKNNFFTDQKTAASVEK